MSTAKRENASLKGTSPLRLYPSVATKRGDRIEDFLRQFPTEDACLDFVKEALWPSGVTRCAPCGRERKHHRVRGRKAYACDRCGNHVYPLRGTVFARSSTPLQKWFYAMCLMASTKHTVSAKRIQRETGVTYKTAWRMLRQLRIVIEARDLRQLAFQIQETAIVNPADPQIHSPESHASGASSQSVLSSEMTCFQGIVFIFNFFPAYLRMCRDL